MNQKTIEEKIDQIHEWVVGNPLKEIEGAVHKLNDHEKRIAHLERTKANRFDWSRIFKFFKVIKTTGGV